MNREKVKEDWEKEPSFREKLEQDPELLAMARRSRELWMRKKTLEAQLPPAVLKELKEINRELTDLWKK